MTPEEYARDSWQNEGTAMPLPPISELRARADQFHRKIRRRNLLEYLAGSFAAVIFIIVAVLVPLSGLRIATVTVLVGIAIVMWQLHKRGAPLTPPENGGPIPVLEFQRRELVRQRDALDSIFVWYLLPLIPGMALMLSIPLMDGLALGEAEALRTTLRNLGLAAILCAALYWLNKVGARKLQVQIDEIDALRT